MAGHPQGLAVLGRHDEAEILTVVLANPIGCELGEIRLPEILILDHFAPYSSSGRLRSALGPIRPHTVPVSRDGFSVFTRRVFRIDDGGHRLAELPRSARVLEAAQSAVPRSRVEQGADLDTSVVWNHRTSGPRACDTTQVSCPVCPRRRPVPEPFGLVACQFRRASISADLTRHSRVKAFRVS